MRYAVKSYTHSEHFNRVCQHVDLCINFINISDLGWAKEAQPGQSVITNS